MTVAILVQATSQATSSAPFVSTTMSNVPKGVRAYMLKKKKFVPRIIPMTQEEIVPKPNIIQQEIASEPNIIQQEIVPEPNIIQQETVPEPNIIQLKEEFDERIRTLEKRLNKTNNNNNNNDNMNNNNNNDYSNNNKVHRAGRGSVEPREEA